MLKQLPLIDLKPYNNLTMLYEMKTHSHTQLAGVRTILSKTKKKEYLWIAEENPDVNNELVWNKEKNLLSTLLAKK